jgi:hypothetical protein
MKIKLIDVVDDTALPLINVDQVPQEGDPLEIKGEMYYVCEKKYKEEENLPEFGVIPLVVKNPAKVQNINTYINCLSLAHRRIQFLKAGKVCDRDNCDEMIIS